MKLDVIYEDNHLIVIDKPPNILSQGDNTGDKDITYYVKAYIKEKYSKPGEVYLGLIHRLDRPVSGVMVFARTSKSAARLSKAMTERDIYKEYLAVVKGELTGEGTLVDYLYKDESLNKVRVVDKSYNGAKRAELRYSSVGVKDGLSLIKIVLMTGRPHQIRVQLSNFGYPIVGDQRYGEGKAGLNIALMCYRMSLAHPTTKEQLSFGVELRGGYPFELFNDITIGGK